LFKWLKNFFSDRTHQTKVGISLSEVVDLLSGVIQGSGIGLIMFIIYTDDLAKLLEQNNITAKMFADDVKVYLEILVFLCLIFLFLIILFLFGSFYGLLCLIQTN